MRCSLHRRVDHQQQRHVDRQQRLAGGRGVYTNVAPRSSSTARGTFYRQRLLRGLSVIDPSTNTFLGNLEVAGTRLLTNSVDAIGNNLIVDAGPPTRYSKPAPLMWPVSSATKGALNVLSGSVLTNGNAFISGASTSLH